MNENVNRAVVLMNLGSPDSTEIRDVRKYLDEFLMDGRVIDYPYLSRMLLVKGIIIPFRVAKSAEAYKTIWSKDGSPLIAISKQLRDELRQRVPLPVEITMRYGTPSPEVTFNELEKKYPQLKEVLLVPMYPHYAMSSYETAVEYALEAHKKNNYGFQIKIIKPYFDEPDYIDALSQSISPYLAQNYDHILFSYHGIPERHILKSDVTGNHCLASANCCEINSPAHSRCYRHQCFKTTKLVVDKAGIPANKYSISFQSRIGKKWLTPYTDFRLQEMPGEGIKNLLVVCPAFVSDCLETLEEIAIRGKETFLAAGGESFTFIPCMNTQEAWVDALTSWIDEYEKGGERMMWKEGVITNS